MSAWKREACPVCKLEARLLYEPSTCNSKVECHQRCGEFQISDQVLTDIEEHPDRYELQKLSEALRFASDRRNPANLSKTEDVRHCITDWMKLRGRVEPRSSQ